MNMFNIDSYEKKKRELKNRKLNEEIYEISLWNGKSYEIDKDEKNQIYNVLFKKLREWLQDEKNQLIENDYNRLILKLKKWLHSRI